ncbi:M14 metallopeptidase family protein [Neptunicella sp. SCSIO 80796]|uniref:M14 family metallopeptidase n=1 Tax=Neptunicella plasticusilytica TaxID=3117012 RepID=UPI003A4DE4B6
MRRISLILLTLCSFQVCSQPVSFEQYQVPGLDKRQIKHADIVPYIDKTKQYKEVEVSQVGESAQGRGIYQFKVGKGKTKILMWSQMHGDEPTATGAVFDLLNMIHQRPQWLASWQDEISLYLVPMINPDGAELSQRYNIQDIDINRDARRLQTPEGRVLMSLAKSIKPDFGFNLHDQNAYYGAGNSGNTATISLLAPAFNAAKEVNDSRRRAMQLIGVLKQVGDEIIPGHMGRYDDTFAPRAFGDNFSKMGISTILIESGAYPNDPNRQVARKTNLAMLHAAISSIADQSYLQQTTDAYLSIPFNNSNAFKDVIVSNLTVNTGAQSYLLDIGMRLNRSLATGRIDEVGDLSTFDAFSRVDATGWKYQACKSYPLSGDKTLQLTKARYIELLKQGYCQFSGERDSIKNQSGYPIVFSLKMQAERPLRGMPAALMMVKQDERRVLINSELIDLPRGE